MILQLVHFQDLTRNDQEMAGNERENIADDSYARYHSFSFTIHERLLNEIL